MPVRIAITGMGIVTSIGNGLLETLDSLEKGKSGIGAITILDTIHKADLMAGEVKLTYEELLSKAGVKDNLPWSRTALLGLIASREALKDAGIEEKEKTNLGMVSATTVGGMDRSEIYYKSFLHDDIANPFIDTHHAGDHTEKIAAELGIQGYITTISTACSSSLNSIMFGARLIKSGLLERVVVGGTDALSKFTLNGFNTLMILDKERCRPFDESRMGLNLGEGAAYLVLEKLDDAQEKGKKIYGEITGYANANDAFHQTASSSDGTGPYLAMEKALQLAGIHPEQVDYINVHGTGTENNDLTEGKAMLRLFGKNLPPFSSTKAYTGHTLGAAGAVEAIISLLSLNNNTIYPNLNFAQPIEEIQLVPVTGIEKVELQTVLTNSFGFGGNDSSVVFEKVRETAETSRNKRKQDEVSRKAVFINGVGAVSPQKTLDDSFLDEITSNEERYLQVIKLNYRDYINPKLLRRMSKIVKMGLVAAKTAQTEAGIEYPDAIVTGTGMGCQADTEKFLDSMLDNNESLLNPTAFIQSTHNTVGAQIALMSGNNNYNLTYVHRTFSLESALLDSMMLINEGKARNVLLGGIDEVTEESWLIKTRLDYFKKEPTENLSLLNSEQKGALAGEGTAFFVLSPDKSARSVAEVKGVSMFFNPEGKLDVAEHIREFTIHHHMEPADIDLVLMGYNGDQPFDAIYQQIESKLFSSQTIGYFKHLNGEHDTSSAFALWIATRILKEGIIPEVIIKRNGTRKDVKKILIYNQFRNVNHSLILLEKA